MTPYDRGAAHQHRCAPSLFNVLSIWGLVVLVLILAISCAGPSLGCR